MATHSAGPSAYSGSGLSFGDDDPFADDVPAAGALELDLPPPHSASSPRSPPAAQSASVSAAGEARSAGVPDLVLPAPKAAPSSSSLRAVTPPPASSFPAGQPQPNAQAPLRPPRNDASSGQSPSSEPSLDAQPSQPLPPVAPAAPPPPNPAAMIARYPSPPSKMWETPAYALKVLWRQFELRQDLASLRKRRSPDVPLYERALAAHDAKTFTLGLVLTCAAVTIALFVFFLPVILRFVRDPS